MPQTTGLLPGSIAMIIFGAALLWGGLAFFITTALRAEQKK
ncbi:MetS family NSS transporter small subunit [Symbiobacterium thermophilum]|uniref:MetS family NSS transporter small subunit n=1 Tax=Symbiobacterium thermophilum (strain DSM 24528 / JCM 14929 / IAM 14863 / T) TaxID=292459 RepID=Q67SB5_SYMTH|nr:MetS family NSS transporter small subunit [Symbiobacterium thermophilum]BAD39428.1 hypothetical protein STH443 [Symbiobacterium thermophilum IAM 14863]